LSITFLLEDHAIISSFFLEDRERNSKKAVWKYGESFQNCSGTSYVRFQLFSSKEIRSP